MGILSGINLASVLSHTIFGGQTYTDPRRVPMTFTSTYRLRQLDPEFKGITSFFESNSVQSLFGAIAGDTGQRQETFTKQAQQASSTGVVPVIEMAVNPNSISWKQAKRVTKRDVQDGSIFFHFTNKNGENNDILTMDFRGNTGNINLLTNLAQTGITQASNDTGAYRKALTWHNLWNLTRERVLLDDNTINEFLIVYNSTIITSEIMLIGFFSNVLEWTDSADKPNSKDYSMSFTVQQVEPPLDFIVSELASVPFDPQTTTIP